MKVKYTSLEQLPITLCAKEVAQVLGISWADAYTQMHSKDFPTIKISKRMVVQKEKLIACDLRIQPRRRKHSRRRKSRSSCETCPLTAWG